MRRLALTFALALLVPGSLAAQSKSSEIDGTFAEQAFGRSTACIGNKLLVGAPYTLSLPSGVGEAHLIYPFGPFATHTCPYTSTSIGDRLGSAVAIIGDINNDGAPDYAVSAPAGQATGRVMIYQDTLGGSIGLPVAIVAGLNDGYGKSLSALGDVNSDGVPEVLVGAPDRPNGSFAQAGAAAVIDIVAQLEIGAIGGSQSSEHLGASVATLGDLDHDGTPDGVSGAPSFLNLSGSPVGRIQVFNARTMAPINSIAGGTAFRQFGAALANVGDVTGDGVDDLLIGAPGTGASAFGAAFLYSGAAISSGSPTPLCSLGGSTYGFGAAVAGLGDVSGDGLRDFAVGAADAAGGLGTVTLYSFSSLSGCFTVAGFTGVAPGIGLGTSIAGDAKVGCDFDLDGSRDFAIGTNSSIGGANGGSVEIYSGSPPVPTPTPTATPSLTPTATVSRTPTPSVTATPSVTLTPTATTTATPTPAATLAPLPDGAELRFIIDRDGNLTGKVRLNRAPVGKCGFRLLGRITAGAHITPIRLLGVVIADQAIVPLAANKLPKVRKSNRHKPVIHLIAKCNCAGNEFFSNVFSRYLNCGTGSGASEREWFSTFSARLRANDAATSSRSH